MQAVPVSRGLQRGAAAMAGSSRQASRGRTRWPHKLAEGAERAAGRTFFTQARESMLGYGLFVTALLQKAVAFSLVVHVTQ